MKKESELIKMLSEYKDVVDDKMIIKILDHLNAESLQDRAFMSTFIFPLTSTVIQIIVILETLEIVQLAFLGEFILFVMFISLILVIYIYNRKYDKFEYFKQYFELIREKSEN